MSLNSNARAGTFIEEITFPQENHVLPEPKKSDSTSKKTIRRHLVTAVALSILIAGSLLSLNIWKSNEQFHKSAVSASKSAPPSTVPPTSTAVASYTVAPTLPRYINIPKLNVHARVLSVGLTGTGALATPSNVFDTAWYNQSAKPGQAGAMLIDGHVSSWTTHGVFYEIKSLANGDTIQIERGDGTLYSFKVIRIQVYTAGTVDMVAVMKPVVSGHPGLNLISCTGDVIPGTSEFSERVVVFAEQVS